MSRELTVKYPEVFRFSGIWMEDIVHETRQGSSIFTLSSTNKLLKQYPWTTGLKTGSTSKAKFCLSATASKDGIDLITVVMGAPDPKTRFQDAKILLNYGFGVSSLYVDQDQDREPLTDLTVKKRNGRNGTSFICWRISVSGYPRERLKPGRKEAKAARKSGSTGAGGRKGWKPGLLPGRKANRGNPCPDRSFCSKGYLSACFVENLSGVPFIRERIGCSSFFFFIEKCGTINLLVHKESTMSGNEKDGYSAL